MRTDELSTSGQPSFSVVIPWYRDRTALRRAIDSVLAQTYPAEQIIVVCNGPGISETQEISEEFCSLGTNITVVSCTQAHANVARNKGADHAIGTHIAFLDADDEFLPNKLQVVAEHLQRVSSQTVMCSGGVRLRATGKSWHFATASKQERETVGQYVIVKGNFLLTSGFVIPTQLARIIRFDSATPKFQDLDFLLRAEAAGYEVKVIPMPLFIYHDEENDNRISRSKNREQDVNWARSHPNLDQQLYHAFVARFVAQHVFPQRFFNSFVSLLKGRLIGKVSTFEIVAMMIRGVTHQRMQTFLFEKYQQIRQAGSKK